MPIPLFINKEEHPHQSVLINAIAQAVYGTDDDAVNTEEFVPREAYRIRLDKKYSIPQNIVNVLG